MRSTVAYRSTSFLYQLTFNHKPQLIHCILPGEIEACGMHARVSASMDPSYLSFLFGGISVHPLALWASPRHSNVEYLALTSGKSIQSILWSLLAPFANHDLPCLKPVPSWSPAAVARKYCLSVTCRSYTSPIDSHHVGASSIPAVQPLSWRGTAQIRSPSRDTRPYHTGTNTSVGASSKWVDLCRCKSSPLCSRLVD